MWSSESVGGLKVSAIMKLTVYSGVYTRAWAKSA
jgi:hypothetical protein